MKNEKAQVTLEALKQFLIGKLFIDGEQVKALDMAIEALKPKTGEWVKVIDEETSNVTKWHYECDQCGAGRWENGQRYCSRCGARMLGGEEE